MCNFTPSPIWCGVEDNYVDMDETLSDEPDLQTVDTMTIDELDALDFPAELPRQHGGF